MNYQISKCKKFYKLYKQILILQYSTDKNVGLKEIHIFKSLIIKTIKIKTSLIQSSYTQVLLFIKHLTPNLDPHHYH
jgi:hypothetical protein